MASWRSLKLWCMNSRAEGQANHLQQRPKRGCWWPTLVLPSTGGALRGGPRLPMRPRPERLALLEARAAASASRRLALLMSAQASRATIVLPTS
eukprot:849855-Prymnesium_polylepis.2